jgi:hypothetical protein
MPNALPQKPAVKKTPAATAKPARKSPARAPVAKPATAGTPAPVRKTTVAAPKPAGSAAPGRTKPVVAGALPVAETRDKPKKAKLVRDSFTMPELEYAALGEVKKACIKAGFEVKKSELLRIGVAMIREMELPALKSAVAALSPLKPGRPRKEK